MPKRSPKKQAEASRPVIASALTAAPVPMESASPSAAPSLSEIDGSRRGRPSLLAAVFFAVALGIALYLARLSIAGEVAAGCGPGSGCGDVLMSRWSAVFGLPVSVLGAGVYAFLLFCSLFLWPATRGQWRLEVMAMVLVLGGALWFTVVQAFVLKAFCPWCGAAHGLASLGVILLWRARRARASALPPDPLALAYLALPVVAVAGLAILQFALPAPERIRQAVTGDSVVTTDGKVSLHHGRILLDPATLPVIGLPDATVTSVALTDFTCPHCRELHRTLTQLASERPGQFSTVLLPGSFDPSAREVHRIMLVLWRLDPALYRQLADGMIDGSIIPTPQELLGRVQASMGGRFFERAWAEARWVEDTLRLGEELLALNSKESQASSLPQLMIGDRVLTGAPRAATVIELMDAAAAPVVPPSAAAVPSAPPLVSHTPTAAPGTIGPATAGGSGAPVIAFASSLTDLGRVTKGETITRRITFTNTGGSPLTIKNIKAGCGCTTIVGWQQTIDPGQPGSFEIKFDSTNFIGTVTKSIEVESNATNGWVKLSLKADVWSPVKVSSSSVSFGNVLKGSSVAPKEIEISVVDTDPLELGGVTSLNPYFKATLKPLEAGRRYQLTVSVPKVGERTQHGELVLSIGHSKLKEMKVSTYINPVDPVVVQPKQINVPLAALAAGTKASLMVYFNGPGVAVLEGDRLAFSGGDDVAVRYEKKPTDRWGRVTLTFPPGYEPSSPSGLFVTFRTNHPSQPEVKVPVHFMAPRVVPGPPSTGPGR